jgi:dTDP-4-dehydrorhamnose reductase
MKILLIGSTGQVGWELQRSLTPLGHVLAVSSTSPGLALDLRHPHRIQEVIREVRPHLIVNAAAYTAVDRAESEPEQAHEINAIAPGILAEEAKAVGATLVHYSTDYVFNGQATTPYGEEATPDPLNVYGKTKLAGEQAIAAVGGSYLILRTSWVYGVRGRNFLNTVFRLAQTHPQLRIVKDQWGSPTWSRTIADSTSFILSRALLLNSPVLAVESGIYHLTSTGVTTWYGFAQKILALAPPPADTPFKELCGITTPEYPTPAQRPAYSVLNTDKVQRQFGLHLPPWEEALTRVISDRLGTAG